MKRLSRPAPSAGPVDALDSVPVFVDSVKNEPPEPLVRCSYFSIECLEPGAGWQLGLSQARIPFLMLGLSGIIQGARSGRPFRGPQDIEWLFTRIERESTLIVDTNEVWLLLELFERMPERGQVFRVPAELFAPALGYTVGRASARSIHELRRRENFREDFRAMFSPEESRAFRAWENTVVRAAKQQYPKDESLRLKYRDGDNDADPSGSGAKLPPSPPPDHGGSEVQQGEENRVIDGDPHTFLTSLSGIPEERDEQQHLTSQ